MTAKVRHSKYLSIDLNVHASFSFLGPRLLVVFIHSVLLRAYLVSSTKMISKKTNIIATLMELLLHVSMSKIVCGVR